MALNDMNNFLYGTPKRGKSAKNPFALGLGDSTSKTSKYERVPVPEPIKKEVLFRQKDSCAHPRCTVVFHAQGIRPHFDHIKRVDDGGPSSSSNIQALCPTHHDMKTHSENVKKAEKKVKKPKKKSDDSPFGSPLLSSPKRGRRDSFF